MDPATAAKLPPGDDHCIWDILYHTVWWQDHLLRSALNKPAKSLGTAVETWLPEPPERDPAAWNALRDQFFDGLGQLRHLCAEADLAAPRSNHDQRPVAYPLLAACLHNSHHLGKIITLRRLLGGYKPQETW